MSWQQQLIVLFRPLPSNAKSMGPADSAQNLSNQLFGRRGHLGGAAGGASSSLPPTAQPSPAQELGALDAADRPSDKPLDLAGPWGSVGDSLGC